MAPLKIKEKFMTVKSTIFLALLNRLLLLTAYRVCFSYLLTTLYLIDFTIGIPRIDSIGKVSDSSASVTENFPNSEEAIRRGEYVVIRSLIRVLEVCNYFQSLVLYVLHLYLNTY